MSIRQTSAYVPKHILVTGGCGFIGSHFVRLLQKEAPHVKLTILDKMTYAAWPHLQEEFSFCAEMIVGDMRDASLVNFLVESVDLIVNFAAETHNDRSLLYPVSCVHANVEGTLVLLEAARRFGCRFHQVSTDEVYGDTSLRYFSPGNVDYDDELCCAQGVLESRERPSSPYAASKAAADALVDAWSSSYGVYATISHGANTYGSYQHTEKFIPRSITTLIEGGTPELYGDGLHQRDWIAVEDHVQAIWTIIQYGLQGEHYHIARAHRLSNYAVMQALMRYFNRSISEVHYVGDRPAHDRAYCLDDTKLTDVLGFSYRYTDFDAQLKATVDWYREHRMLWQDQKQRSEAELYAHRMIS